jgi:hypothetical protein
MRAPLLALALAALLAIGPAVAAEAPAWQRDLEDGAQRLRQGLDKALGEALGQVDEWLRAMPQYEMPQMNENGDIIIRRKRPAPTGRGGGTAI